MLVTQYFFYIYFDCEDVNERIPITCDEDVHELFSRNVVSGEIHVWINVELVAPFASELHVINIDDDEDEHIVITREGVEEVGVHNVRVEGDAQFQEEGEHVEEGTAAGVQKGYERAVAGVSSDEGAVASV